MNPTTQFAKDVVGGYITAGKLQVLACERHLNDLERGAERGLSFDEVKAQKALDFFPKILRLAAGKYEGKPFNLLPWQQFIIGSIYGWQRNGKRRYSKAYVENAKGSGKTPLAAGMAIKSICADGEARAECYIMARTAEQALVTFRTATAMVELSPFLRERLDVMGGANPYNIAHPDSRSFMRRMSSDKLGRGKSGPIPHFLLVDEYHEHDSSAMLEFFDAGTKNRDEPLTLIITNSGSGMDSPCGQEHSYGVRILDGVTDDDDYFVFITALDDGDDPFEDETCWIKANPSLPDIPGYEYLRKQMAKGRGFPSKRALVERLNLCKWSEAISPWLDRDIWMQCEVKKLSGLDRRDCKCYIAIDLSLKTDLTAAALLFDDGERLYAEVKVWTPADTLEERSANDNTPYDLWAADGYIDAVDGKVLDYGHIAGWLSQMSAEYDVQGVAYDPWNMDLLELAMDRVGVRTTRERGDSGALFLIAHPQGFVAGSKAVSEGRGLFMPRSINDTEDVILNGKLSVVENPVVRAAALGTIVVMDASQNRRFNKQKATSKIDPMVALTMAIGFAIAWRDDAGAMNVDDMILQDFY